MSVLFQARTSDGSLVKIEAVDLDGFLLCDQDSYLTVRNAEDDSISCVRKGALSNFEVIDDHWTKIRDLERALATARSCDNANREELLRIDALIGAYKPTLPAAFVVAVRR